MSLWNVLGYTCLGLLVLWLAVYVSARLGSLGYFRSRDEYHTTMFNKYFGKGDSHDGKGSE